LTTSQQPSTGLPIKSGKTTQAGTERVLKSLPEGVLAMKSDIQELHAILERVDKLETQNRRLRRDGLAILVLLSAFMLMGQAPPSPRVVEAQRFVLKDSGGNVRGWMGTIGKGSELTLGNVNAQPMMRLIVSMDDSDLHFFGSRKSGMNLGLDSGNADISMIGAEGNGGARITFKEPGPSFALEDAKGFSTIVGATQLEKPKHRKADPSTAASIVLLDKDKNVIWQTP
jgi:hypothetical protein